MQGRQVADADHQRVGLRSTIAEPFRRDLRALVRGVVPLFLSVGLLNASNYAFHVVATRVLAPREYGGLSGLLAFLLVVSVPCGVFQAVAAKRSAVLDVDGRAELGSFTVRTTRGAATVGGVAAAAILAASPLLAAFLHVGVFSAALLAPFVLFTFATSVPLGVLQGRKRFVALGLASSAGVIARFGIGVALMYAGWGITGALLGSVLSQVLVLAASVRLQGLSRSAWRVEGASIQGVRGELGSTLAALTGFWLLVEADLVLARHFLGPGASGVYAAAGILARAILFLPAAISLVALPHFAEAVRDAERLRRWLHLSLAATGVLAFGAAAVLAIFGRPLLSLTFGARYATGSELLRFLAPAMAGFALLNVFIYFHIAAGSKAYRLVFLALAVETGLVALGHGTGDQIAVVVLGVGGALVALLWHASHAVLRWRPEDDAAVAFSVIEERGSAAEAEIELSVVLPCHNAGTSLAAVLDGLLRATDGVSLEVIVVSDGSTDDTVKVAREYPSDAVTVLSYAERAGKGQALHVGLAAARGDYVAFMDADGDIDPGALEPFLSIVRHYQPDIVLGSKRHPLSQVHYPPLRRLMSWIYHKLTRVLFRVNVRDTQTGLKLIRRDVLQAVLPRMLEKRYAFDLEFLVVARLLGYTAVFEAPVTIDYRFASNVDPRAAFRILLDTMAIFYRRYVLDTYGSVRAQGSSVHAYASVLAERNAQVQMAAVPPGGGPA